MDRRQNLRKIKEGIVLSDKMDKTIVVQVDRLAKHKKYSRVIRKASKFKVHDEKRQAKVGARVRIMETRPLSKEKRWRLIEVLKAPEATTAEQEPIDSDTSIKSGETK